MKTLSTIALFTAISLIAVSAADAKRSPRLEKLALNAADAKTASGALVTKADLAAGWKGGPTKPDDSAPDCAFQNFSAYTVTGESEADFSQGPAELISSVQVFRSHADALGDFKESVQPKTAACEATALAKVISKTAKVVSAKTVAAPKTGDRAVDFEFVIRDGSTTYYGSIVGFLQGRAQGAMISFSAGARISGLRTLLARMSARLLPPTVA